MGNELEFFRCVPQLRGQLEVLGAQPTPSVEEVRRVTRVAAGLARARRFDYVDRRLIGLGDVAHDFTAALALEDFATDDKLEAQQAFGGVRVSAPRVAAAAGGDWPAIVHRLIEANMAEEQAEREAGLKKLPPGMVVMIDLHAVWPNGEDFLPTRQLVTKLITHNPDYWGPSSPYGRPLTDTRLGRLIDQATKVTSSRIGGRGDFHPDGCTVRPA